LTVCLIAAFGNNSPLAEPPSSKLGEMQIRRDASLIAVSGQVSSPAHEAILRDLLSRSDIATPVAFELHEVQISPPGWALVTELALRATLLTRFSQVTVDSAGVLIRGVTSEPLEWAAAIDRLRSALLPGMQLDTRVIELAPAPAFARLCQTQFDALTSKGSIGFAVGRAEITTRAQALLDGLIETATDCSGWQISIRAHGDGASAGNTTLAELRAQSIVDYLTGHGLERQRIVATAETGSASNRQAALAASYTEPH